MKVRSPLSPCWHPEIAHQQLNIMRTCPVANLHWLLNRDFRLESIGGSHKAWQAWARQPITNPIHSINPKYRPAPSNEKIIKKIQYQRRVFLRVSHIWAYGSERTCSKDFKGRLHGVYTGIPQGDETDRPVTPQGLETLREIKSSVLTHLPVSKLWRQEPPFKQQWPIPDISGWCPEMRNMCPDRGYHRPFCCWGGE